jgi:hypothetical protein
VPHAEAGCDNKAGGDPEFLHVDTGRGLLSMTYSTTFIAARKRHNPGRGITKWLEWLKFS